MSTTYFTQSCQTVEASYSAEGRILTSTEQQGRTSLTTASGGTFKKAPYHTAAAIHDSLFTAKDKMASVKYDFGGGSQIKVLGWH